MLGLIWRCLFAARIVMRFPRWRCQRETSDSDNFARNLRASTLSCLAPCQKHPENDLVHPLGSLDICTISNRPITIEGDRYTRQPTEVDPLNPWFLSKLQGGTPFFAVITFTVMGERLGSSNECLHWFGHFFALSFTPNIHYDLQYIYHAHTLSKYLVQF